MPRKIGTPELIEVTPEQADTWLAGAKSTYRNPEIVAQYAERYRDGTWNPETRHATPVRLYNGRVYDGHHRLTAVIQTGLTVPLWVSIKEEA